MRNLTQLAFALAAFRGDNAAFPTKLVNLAPKYITSIPKDLFSDGELNYRADGDGYLLYSVGVNGRDDGGKGLEDDKSQEGWDDIAVRMTAR